MKHHYAGVGARKTPEHICLQMENIGFELGKLGFILRSGGAEGADWAFMNGALDAGAEMEILLPRKGFGGFWGGITDTPDEAFERAASIHPAWGRCSPFAQRLHARNIQQVLGVDLSEPVDFVICWTPGGAEIGGTRTAIVCAQMEGIPVYNLGDVKSREELFAVFRA